MSTTSFAMTQPLHTYYPMPISTQIKKGYQYINYTVRVVNTGGALVDYYYYQYINYTVRVVNTGGALVDYYYYQYINYTVRVVNTGGALVDYYYTFYIILIRQIY